MANDFDPQAFLRGDSGTAVSTQEPSKTSSSFDPVSFVAGRPQGSPIPVAEAEANTSQFLQIPHRIFNDVREFGSSAGRYIFQGLQGISHAQAKLLANPPPELVEPQAEEVLLPQAEQDRRRTERIVLAQRAAPKAEETAQYWQKRAAQVDTESGVDPNLAQTWDSRISRAGGGAAIMGLESMVPYAGVPLMALHGASAAEAEAISSGKTEKDAETDAVRSLIGLTAFGGANKAAALAVAKLIPAKSALVKFMTQFLGQDAANETASRAIDAWTAASDAKPGEKVAAATKAFTDTTLEESTLNAVYAGMGAFHASRGAVDPRALAAANAEGVKAVEARVPAQETPVPFGFGPGAAAVGETLRPSEPTAKQLADILSGISAGDPHRFAKSMSNAVDQFHAAKTGLERAAATVGNLGRGFKRLVWDAPTVTNFDRWKGKWDATLQYNDFHIKRLGNELDRAVPNGKRQEAIYNWAAADGDEALLRQWAEKAPKDVRPGYVDALTLTDEEKRLGNLQRSAYDEWLQRAVENGMLRTGVDNYLKRVVVKRPEIEADLKARLHTGRFSTNFRESKRRFWDEMVDAEQAGIRYNKRARGQSLYAQSFEHALINRLAVRQFFEGETETGRPFAVVEGLGIPVEKGEQNSPALMVTPFGARTVRGTKELAQRLQRANPLWSEAKATAIAKEKILAEYEPLDHPAFKNWQWVHAMEDGTQVFVRGDALVHRSIAPKLRNAFEKERIDWLDPILKAQSFVKGSKLSLSLFHNVHEAVNAAGHLTNPANLRPLHEYLEMPEIKRAMEAGLKLVGSAHEQAYFAEGMGSHGWPELVPFLGDYVKAFKDASFEDWIPRLKAEAYLRAFERNQKGGITRLRPSRKLSAEQNAVLTSRQVNATFGEQNYRQMMRDPRLQQALQGMFLAPDFGESKVRHIGQAFTRYGSEQRMAIGLVAAGLYLGSRILNQAFSGNPQWNKPLTVVVGNREYSLRSLPGDLAHLITDPRSYVTHRLSPAIQNAQEWLFRRDAFGKVVDWGDRVKDFFLSFVPIPLTHRAGLSWKDQIASAMGITPMQYRYENEIRKVITQWKKTSKDPKLIHEVERAEKETFLPSDYAPLRQALRDENNAAALDEYKKLIALKGGALHGTIAVKDALHRWSEAPLTGSKKGEARFKATLKPEQRDLYEKARGERRSIWKRFEAMRQGNLKEGFQRAQQTLQGFNPESFVNGSR